MVPHLPPFCGNLSSVQSIGFSHTEHLAFSQARSRWKPYIMIPLYSDNHNCLSTKFYSLAAMNKCLPLCLENKQTSASEAGAYPTEGTGPWDTDMMNHHHPPICGIQTGYLHNSPKPFFSHLGYKKLKDIP